MVILGYVVDPQTQPGLGIVRLVQDIFQMTHPVAGAALGGDHIRVGDDVTFATARLPERLPRPQFPRVTAAFTKNLNPAGFYHIQPRHCVRPRGSVIHDAYIQASGAQRIRAPGTVRHAVPEDDERFHWDTRKRDGHTSDVSASTLTYWIPASSHRSTSSQSSFHDDGPHVPCSSTHRRCISMGE